MPEVPYVPYVLRSSDGLLHVDLGGDLLPVGARRPHPRRAPGLEELPCPPVDRIGVLPVVLVEFQHVAEVRPEKLVLRLSLQPDHTLTCRYLLWPERRARWPDTLRRHPPKTLLQSDQTSRSFL